MPMCTKKVSHTKKHRHKHTIQRHHRYSCCKHQPEASLALHHLIERRIIYIATFCWYRWLHTQQYIPEVERTNEARYVAHENCCIINY